ncbi:asparagine synthase-related protein [Novosphingobium bradum]|uniref:Asparagine synthase-related protein n=1 Tax=Novosphingobium bradum TaxID=1737444 RepID=A0ABV7IQN5_9SPHN
MLAFFRGAEAERPDLADRAARSLGLFFGAPAPTAAAGPGRQAWQLPPVSAYPARHLRARSASLRAWRPVTNAAGGAVLLHGYLDNAVELARELGLPGPAGVGEDPHARAARDPAYQARVYAAAVARWGDEADGRMVGHYCSVHDDPVSGVTRLARSPYYGPPLHYFVAPESIGVASTLRVLEALGLERRLDRRRLAESLFFLHGADEGYLEGGFRLHHGCIARIAPGRREVVRFHDALAIPDQPPASPEDYLREADRLLTEAVGRTHASGRQPGMLLTGGLDSSNATARLVPQLPPGQRLHTFTYVPQPDHGASDLPGCLIDEGPAVLAFARGYPALAPHLVDNAGITFDHRLDEMFLAMGTGTVNAAIFFRYHGLYAAAREQGCDMLLSCDHGNATFSAEGDWGFAEYLRHGRLRQLWRALKGYDRHPGSLFWRFCSRAVVPMLPDGLWRLAMRLRGTDPTPDNVRIGALRPEVVAQYGLVERARAHGTLYERNWYASRRQQIVDSFGRGDVEGSDMIQGFEQLYEVAMRDATAYRPLVEFCAGLPTDMFLRDGTMRWLARELGKGRMPEEQRLMKGHGQHGTDWWVRMNPRIADLRRAVAEIRRDPLLDGLIDSAVLEADLDNWPDGHTWDESMMTAGSMRLPRTIALARYVQFMSGGNRL